VLLMVSDGRLLSCSSTGTLDEKAGFRINENLKEGDAQWSVTTLVGWRVGNWWIRKYTANKSGRMKSILLRSKSIPATTRYKGSQPRFSRMHHVCDF